VLSPSSVEVGGVQNLSCSGPVVGMPAPFQGRSPGHEAEGKSVLVAVEGDVAAEAVHHPQSAATGRGGCGQQTGVGVGRAWSAVGDGGDQTFQRGPDPQPGGRAAVAALSGRAVIDQALGIIMGQRRCSADEAFGVLREVSQTSNVKLRAQRRSG
jgi:ANTAR domain